VSLVPPYFEYPIWRDLKLLLSERWSCRSLDTWMAHIATWPVGPDGQQQRPSRRAPSVRGLQIWALAQLMLKVHETGDQGRKHELTKAYQEQAQQDASLMLLLRDHRLHQMASLLGYNDLMATKEWLIGSSRERFVASLHRMLTHDLYIAPSGRSYTARTGPNPTPFFFVDDMGRSLALPPVPSIWEPPTEWPEKPEGEGHLCWPSGPRCFWK